MTTRGAVLFWGNAALLQRPSPSFRVPEYENSGESMNRMALILITTSLISGCKDHQETRYLKISHGVVMLIKSDGRASVCEVKSEQDGLLAPVCSPWVDPSNSNNLKGRTADYQAELDAIFEQDGEP